MPVDETTQPVTLEGDVTLESLSERLSKVEADLAIILSRVDAIDERFANIARYGLSVLDAEYGDTTA